MRPRTALYCGNLGWAIACRASSSSAGSWSTEGYTVTVRGDGPGDAGPSALGAGGSASRRGPGSAGSILLGGGAPPRGRPPRAFRTRSFRRKSGTPWRPAGRCGRPACPAHAGRASKSHRWPGPKTIGPNGFCFLSSLLAPPAMRQGLLGTMEGRVLRAGRPPRAPAFAAEAPEGTLTWFAKVWLRHARISRAPPARPVRRGSRRRGRHRRVRRAREARPFRRPGCSASRPHPASAATFWRRGFEVVEGGLWSAEGEMLLTQPEVAATSCTLVGEPASGRPSWRVRTVRLDQLPIPGRRVLREAGPPGGGTTGTGWEWTASGSAVPGSCSRSATGRPEPAGRFPSHARGASLRRGGDAQRARVREGHRRGRQALPPPGQPRLIRGPSPRRSGGGPGAGGEVDPLLDEVVRPRLHLVEDRADVLADDPEEDELDAAEDRDQDDDRRPAGGERGVAGTGRGSRRRRRPSPEGEAEVDGRLQGRLAERDDAVQAEAHHAAHGVLAASGPPRGHLERNPMLVNPTQPKRPRRNRLRSRICRWKTSHNPSRNESEIGRALVDRRAEIALMKR